MARRDDEGARLAGDVHEGLLPGVAVVRGRGEVDLDPRLVEREAGERHVVLPADQAADPAERGRDRAEPAAVALPPDEALVVRRHELAVVQRELAGGREGQQRVVERRPGPLGVDLVDADDEPDAVLLRRRTHPVDVRAGDLNRLACQPCERLLGRGGRPARELLRPDRRGVCGYERLGQDDELRALAGRLAGEPLELGERRVAVEDRRLGLDAGDGDRVAHAASLLPDLPLGLRVDADAVGDPVDVREVGDHLDRVVDRLVAEARGAQGLEVGRADRGGIARQRDGEVAERARPVRQVAAAVVVCRVDGPVCCALGTEVVGVRARSVVAGVRVRDDRREQLPLLTRERGRAEHDLAIQRHRRAEDARPQAHRPHDVEDLPGAADRGLVLLGERARRLVDLDLADVRHGPILSARLRSRTERHGAGAPAGLQNR